MIKKGATELSTPNFWMGFSVLIILTSGLAIILQWIQPNLIHKQFWIIQAFFGIISILSHIVSTLGVKNKDEFHVFYLGSMAVRFILSLFFILASVVFLKEYKITYVANFFILYIIYASFEIYHLLRNLRADSQRNGN